MLLRGVIGAAQWYADWRAGGPIDQAEGQPDVAEGVKALHRKDWRGFEALYAARSSSDRYHFLQGVTNLSNVEHAWPPIDTAERATITMGLCVGWAWRHRGYAVGSMVTRAGAHGMWRLARRALEIADDLGEEADGVALALAIRAQMAMDGGRGALQRFLNAAAKPHRSNIFAPRNHLLFVAPKWHGSADEVYSAAREYAHRPATAAWLALPVMAHIEVMTYQLNMSDNESGSEPVARFSMKARPMEKSWSISTTRSGPCSGAAKGRSVMRRRFSHTICLLTRSTSDRWTIGLRPTWRRSGAICSYSPGATICSKGRRLSCSASALAYAHCASRWRKTRWRC